MRLTAVHHMGIELVKHRRDSAGRFGGDVAGRQIEENKIVARKGYHPYGAGGGSFLCGNDGIGRQEKKRVVFKNHAFFFVDTEADAPLRNENKTIPHEHIVLPHP